MSHEPKWPYDDILEQLKGRYNKEGLAAWWQGERDAIRAALRAISLHLPEERYLFKQVIGVGGSGVVIRLNDRLFPKIDKALKFPRPVVGRIQDVAEMLEKEIGFLADLRHPGVVAIIEYATLASQDTYQKLPFYLMEFVDGSPSRDFSRAATTTEEAFRSVVRNAADTLRHLHEGDTERFAHLDLKAENIMVTASGRPILIDLGTCKRLRTDETQTIVACTRSNAHPELVRLLQKDPSDENRAKGNVLRSQIDPKWDLWSFGLTLLDWLGVDRENGNVAEGAIYHRLEAYTRKYYMLVAARLLTYSIRSWLAQRVGLSDDFIRDFPINTANQLCDCLDRLDGRGPLAKVEELGDPSSGSIQAAPETHVPSTLALKEALEHRLYRRLNSITQLGLVSQVYPGAKHSRREHSLGTYANVARMLRALYNDSYSPLFRQVITEDDCRSVLLAALLHDIGQFPLAHDLEEIDDKVFSHSDLTNGMLRGEWSKKKRGSKAVSFESLDRVFALWRVERGRVESILAAKPMSAGSSRKDKLLRSLFSGPIDADKLDYLLRDAIHTGVPYPLGIDVNRLLRCITVIVLGVAGAKDVPVIGVHAKGKVAAEFLTLARYAMFSQVYWHHAVRAQKAMLSRAIGALLSKIAQDDAIEGFKSDFVEMVAKLPEALYVAQPRELPLQVDSKMDFEFGSFGDGTDLAPTDAAVLSWFGERLREVNLAEVMLIEGLLERKLFKRLWVVSHDMDPKRWDKIVTIWDQLDRAKRNRACLEFEQQIGRLLKQEKMVSVTGLHSGEAREVIGNRTAGEVPWLLIDIPGARPGAQVGLAYVLEGQRRQLRKNDRAVGDLQDSLIWEKYAKCLREEAGKIRVFCDQGLVDTVEASVSSNQGLDALEEALMQVAS